MSSQLPTILSASFNYPPVTECPCLVPISADTRETGFVNAISAAGIAYSVTKACSSGNLVECTCHSNYTQFTGNHQEEKEQEDGHSNKKKSQRKNMFIKNLFNSRNLRRQLKKANAVKASGGDWKWGGCSDNLQFGLNKSKAFLDARIRSRRDIKTLVKTHNNIAGLLVSGQIFGTSGTVLY